MKKNTIIIAFITAVLGGVFYEYNDKKPTSASNIEPISTISEELEHIPEKSEIELSSHEVIISDKINKDEDEDEDEKKHTNNIPLSLKKEQIISLENRMVNKTENELEYPIPDGWTLRETLTGMSEDSFFKTVDSFLEGDVMSREHEKITPASYVKINIESIIKLSVGDAYFLPEINGVQHKVFIKEIDDSEGGVVITGNIENYDWDDAVTLYYYINNDEVLVYINTPDGEFELRTIEGKGAIHSRRVLNEQYDKIFKEEEYTQWINDHRSEPENRDSSF